MTETYAQLEGLWDQAGGNTSLAPLMAAIAEAESGGNPSSNNYTDNNGTQTSWGLWQISDGTHNMPVPNIDDPLVNAEQAVAKYKSQGLTAWGTYDTGAYKQFLNGNVPAAAPSGTPATTASQPFVWYEPWTWGNAASSVQTGLSDVGKNVLKFSAEGLAVIAGLGLVAWGIGRAAGGGHSSSPLQVIEQAAPAAASV